MTVSSHYLDNMKKLYRYYKVLAEKALQDKLKTGKANFNALLRAAGHGNLYAGLEGALFGRFVTSDILARSDAPVHVAHAFTVHPEEAAFRRCLNWP